MELGGRVLVQEWESRQGRRAAGAIRIQAHPLAWECVGGRGLMSGVGAEAAGREGGGQSRREVRAEEGATWPQLGRTATCGLKEKQEKVAIEQNPFGGQ